VDGAADGALLGAVVAQAVRDGGTVVTVRGYSEPGERGVRFEPIRVRDYGTAHDKLDSLRRAAEEGKITLRVAGTFPKQHAAEAHRRLEAGGARGRFVIEF
jgi:NADPH:quinone reductase-like Zn-dependent oxidoreductase